MLHNKQSLKRRRAKRNELTKGEEIKYLMAGKEGDRKSEHRTFKSTLNSGRKYQAQKWNDSSEGELS
jgi:hypothetical protein